MVAEGRRWVVLVAAVALAGCTESVTPSPQAAGPTVTVSLAATAAGGGPAGDADLASAAQVLRHRLAAARIDGAQVTAAVGGVRIAVPAGREQDVRQLAVVGRLSFRTVLGSMPAGSTHATATVAPPGVQPRLEAFDCAAPRQPGTGTVALACDKDRTTKYALDAPFLANDSITRATVQPPGEQSPTWSILLDMTDRGGGIWSQYTTEHVDQQVAIEVDGTVLSAPTIAGPITGGDTQISGQFTEREALAIAAVVGSPPLPVVLS